MFGLDGLFINENFWLRLKEIWVNKKILCVDNKKRNVVQRLHLCPDLAQSLPSWLLSAAITAKWEQFKDKIQLCQIAGGLNLGSRDNSNLFPENPDSKASMLGAQRGADLQMY